MDILTKRQFEEIAAIAQEHWGLDLTEKKHALVQNRLTKLLSRSEYASIEQYLSHLRTSATDDDMLVFFDLLSTNTTSFFREKEHFDYLAGHVYPAIAQAPPRTTVRIWSAACSNGSEPYTIGIHARECLPNIDKLDFKILATDLSRKVLQQARLGVYPSRAIEDLPKPIRAKYFEPRQRQADGRDETVYQVHHSVRSLVTIHELNLIGQWPMKGPFNVIFLRNVMIYFNAETRAQLVRKMHGLLADDGVLVIGSAETLSGLQTGFRMVRPSVYVK